MEIANITQIMFFGFLFASAAYLWGYQQLPIKPHTEHQFKNHVLGASAAIVTLLLYLLLYRAIRYIILGY